MLAHHNSVTLASEHAFCMSTLTTIEGTSNAGCDWRLRKQWVTHQMICSCLSTAYAGITPGKGKSHQHFGITALDDYHLRKCATAMCDDE